jgi:transcription elongation GreA/GreB family factor
MDKAALVDQLAEKLRARARVADAESDAAAAEARDGATPNERREDSRTALEFSRMARAQGLRARELRSALDVLENFRPKALPDRARVELGALVEIEDEEGRGQTLFLAPVGAGEELTGPGGDGFFTVVTPASPIGGAVMGRREGESASVRVRGEMREWTVVWVG